MLQSVIPIGNSKGIRLSKIILDKLSIKDKVEMEVMEDAIVLRPVKTYPREGWKEAFCKMHERGEDELLETPLSENFDWEW
jgi:hypothetical protein